MDMARSPPVRQRPNSLDFALSHPASTKRSSSAKLDIQNQRTQDLHKFTLGLRRSLFFCLVLPLVCSAVAQSVSPELFNGMKWRLIGPFRGGRVVAVAGVPGDSTTFYFGAVDGGVWKTTDAGVVWTPIFDNQNVASIGAIAVAPSDPKTIYVGTGESDIRSDLASGNGVYKSVDGGSTWTSIGLEDTRQISRIVVDPQNPQVVYVGALGHAYGPNEQRGVFKSIDGGAHWTKVLDQGPEIGVSDLVLCSSNPQILFAGTWHTRRPLWSVYAPIDGTGSGLYRSQDAGRTWSRLAGTGLPEGDWGRIGVAVAPDGKRVYALIPAKKKPGLYRSDDGGNTWVLENADSRLTSRPWYFNSITVDPNNRDVIYIPNIALYLSEDGGKTISVFRGAPGGDDYHQIWIDPKNSSSMVLGTDQGTTISLNRGQTWSSWYNQPTAQLYHVITDNKFPYVVYGAQQDTGSVAVPSRSDHGQITLKDWFPAGPTESGYITLDPDDSNLTYQSEPYGTVTRFDRRTGFSQDISPWPAPIPDEIAQRKYRAPWSPVLIFSPVDTKALYLGTQFAMKTVDGGLHWETISPDLTGAIGNGQETTTPGTPTNDSAKKEGYGVISTIALSPLNRDLIWTGSDTGLIHLTRDGGKTWKDATPQGLTDWSEISLIEASHFDPAVAYAAVDRSRLDDQKPYIYRTRDYGATWQLIANGISAPCFLRAIREDPATRGLLFAGTEFGAYVSLDDGDHWQSLQLNLPVSSVRDLAIHGDDLVAATHGRSFWILDNITPLRQAAEAAKAANAWLYRPATAMRIDNDSFSGTPLPPEEPAAENPPNGAMIDYLLKFPAKDIELEIFDARQKLVRKFYSQGQAEDQSVVPHSPLPVAERWLPKPEVLAKTPGMHRFVWDLMWKSSGGPIADEDAQFNNPAGPKAVPGMYRVRLTVDGQTLDQSLRIAMDPRSSATPDVLAQQLELGLQLFNETMEPRRALAEIASVQKQLADLREKLGTGSDQLKSALTEADAEIGTILTRKQENSGQAPGLKDAYRDLASALRVVEGGDRTVPSQAIAVYQESSPLVKARIADWTAYKQTKLPRLNQLLSTGKLPTLIISEK
jgi:photosystem II stability/assembly factor-like uncharacterized protein